MHMTFSEIENHVTTEKIREIENKIGRDISLQYKSFILDKNGARPKPSHFNIQWKDQECAGWNTGSIDFFLSMNEESDASFIEFYETYKERIPSDTIPIASDPGSNLILLGTGKKNNGKVFFWMHDYEVEEEKADYSNVGLIANSFNEFIDALYDEKEDEA